jgi:hypothetical protein
VTQTASATQNPLTSLDSPINGMLSVVNEKSPFMPSSIFDSRVPGIRSWVAAQAGAKSSSVNGSTDGITSAASTGRMSSALTGIGRCP